MNCLEAILTYLCEVQAKFSGHLLVQEILYDASLGKYQKVLLVSSKAEINRVQSIDFFSFLLDLQPFSDCFSCRYKLLMCLLLCFISFSLFQISLYAAIIIFPCVFSLFRLWRVSLFYLYSIFVPLCMCATFHVSICFQFWFLFVFNLSDNGDYSFSVGFQFFPQLLRIEETSTLQNSSSS